MFDYIIMKQIFTGLVILGLLSKGLAIDCYVCYNGENDCGEVPDTASLVARGATASGCGSCTKTFSFMGTKYLMEQRSRLEDTSKQSGCSNSPTNPTDVWSTVARGCSPSETVMCKNIIGHGHCSCTTTYCNGGRRSTMHQALMVPCFVILLCFVLL